jgi:hypothetical protein
LQDKRSLNFQKNLNLETAATTLTEKPKKFLTNQTLSRSTSDLEKITLILEKQATTPG